MYPRVLTLQITVGISVTSAYTPIDFPEDMDPAVVDSASFGLLWKTAFEAKELVSDAA